MTFGLDLRQIHNYRETTKKHKKMAGVPYPTHTCRRCGKRMPNQPGQRKMVDGKRPRLGFLCLDCHSKRLEPHMNNLERDAARYRFLREKWAIYIGKELIRHYGNTAPLLGIKTHAEKLDFIIDGLIQPKEDAKHGQ